MICSRDTFAFDHQDLFLFFSPSILPQRLAAIRRLHLCLETSDIKQPFLWADFAPKGQNLMWEIIGRDIHGLKHLRLGLMGEHGAPYPTMNPSRWMESILQVRNLKTFHLDFYAPSNNWDELGDGGIELWTLLNDHMRSIVCSRS